jgi:hypothetical protein
MSRSVAISQAPNAIATLVAGEAPTVRILVWHVHGAWTTAFVHGPHSYLIPTLPDRGPYGRGRATTYLWPDQAVECGPEHVASADVDVVVLQRPEELAGMAEQWLGGRRPGRDVPCIYLEHNAPQGRIAELRHPAADRRDLVLCHVTHFNHLFWDAGTTETTVIEHGVVDPGDRYSGGIPHACAVINEPIRRGRVTGTDILERLGRRVPIDLFGMQTQPLGGADLPQPELHAAMAQRRVYLHPNRWTSLGLSLLEAMHLGMPVACLATTEAPEAVPPAAGICTNRLDRLEQGLRRLLADPAEAASRGRAARAHALQHYGLERFLGDWDRLLARVV